MVSSILFVCMGNICRSPTAEGVFRQLVDAQDEIRSPHVDSAGTIGYHSGEKADFRAVQAAKLRGYDLSSIISRKVADSDFTKFDLIIAMDRDNFSNLAEQARRCGCETQTHKIKLFLDYSEQTHYVEVPDPYYGGSKGFDLVIDLIEDASHGLIREIKES